jgi:hypothetical protein
MKRLSAGLTVATCLTIFAQSVLALDVNQLVGAKTVIKSPSGRNELCVSANRLMPKAYNDNDTKDEADLCAYNFYSNMALCPKMSSTNPGVMITKIIEGKTRAQTMALCNSEQVSTKAKFKSSISCSYTPSILGYYHLSKMLKAGNVPAAVLRTMDKQEHLSVTNNALKMLSGQTSNAIYQTWNTFRKAHDNNTNNNIFDSSRGFVFGALSENPKKEYRYREMSGPYKYETRYETFLSQTPYQKIINPASVETMFTSSDLRSRLQTILTMKDVSDVVLMDTLMNQEDRVGNIHYKMAWYTKSVDPSTNEISFKREGSKAEMKPAIEAITSMKSVDEVKKMSSWIIPEKELAIQAAGGLLVQEMMLKDNDCGVDVATRTNMMRKNDGLERIRHMSVRTYKKFIELYKTAQKPDFKTWLMREMQFTAADAGNITDASGKSFYANLNKAYSILNKNCKSGVLKLDLNVDDLISGKPAALNSCD